VGLVLDRVVEQPSGVDHPNLSVGGACNNNAGHCFSPGSDRCSCALGRRLVRTWLDAAVDWRDTFTKGTNLGFVLDQVGSAGH